jgi:site-specific DNA-methyltransferase (adenine-specific)
MSATFHKGDNLKIISEQIKDKSIDFIYFNPPFATTKQKWDEKLDWKKLFEQFFRILKDDGIIAIHCSVPFNYLLIREAPRPPNYSWYWKKENSTNPLLAKTQPLRNTEEILVWTNKRCRYYPQRVGTEKRLQREGGGNAPRKDGTCYYGKSQSWNRSLNSERVMVEVTGRFQTHHIEMKRHVDGFSTRPQELVELMINSYTKEGDTILDPTCYLGMCGAIAKKMKRNWIGIDKNFYPLKLMCV